MNPPVAPSVRNKQVMAYDAEHGVVVLFGGQTPSGPIANDTWIYHYPSNTWKQIETESSPSARYLAQIAYDPEARRTVVFGGATAAGINAEIWGLTLTRASANTLPTISLTSPAAGSTYTEPASINLAASAADTDGTVVRVEFFAGATKIGETQAAPHQITWTGVPAGTYSLTARATDNTGASAVSAPVAVTVNPDISGPSNNAALAANGAVATASSAYSSAYLASTVNDGIRNGGNWGAGGGWNDATSNGYPDWVQIDFGGLKSINRINVITLADNYAAGVDPTPTTTFSNYGITSFDVQYWTGLGWATVPGGAITGNNLVVRSVSFPTVSTSRIRVVVNSALYDYSRIVEIEAWTD
jgi:hypothetical protein